MIETENKVYARRCESHVEALRRAVPGCIEKVEWQCEDQLTITVKQDKLPEAVHYLYYERYGWIPVIIGNDERSPVSYTHLDVYKRQRSTRSRIRPRTSSPPARSTPLPTRFGPRARSSVSTPSSSRLWWTPPLLRMLSPRCV